MSCCKSIHMGTLLLMKMSFANRFIFFKKTFFSLLLYQCSVGFWCGFWLLCFFFHLQIFVLLLGVYRKHLNFVNKDHNPNTPCHEWTNLHHHLMCVIILLRTIKLWIFLLSRPQICQDFLFLFHKWVVRTQHALIHLCGRIKILNFEL